MNEVFKISLLCPFRLKFEQGEIFYNVYVLPVQTINNRNLKTELNGESLLLWTQSCYQIKQMFP
jgi:hypothetical protein